MTDFSTRTDLKLTSLSQFWGEMVARAGAGPNPIPHKRLTAENLADAIRFCLRAESQERAKELANKMVGERGSETGAQSFHKQIQVEELRCTLVPSKSAVWRVRRTKVRLSAFAACTLASENLLDFKDLKLFRAREYYTDEGPVDPISGGFTAACRAFSDMGLGILETPTETYKAMKLPFRSGREKSSSSVPTMAGSTGDGGRSSRKPSGASSLASGVERASRSATSQDDAESVRAPRDMLRRTGAHVSQGIGRSLTALAVSPIEISASLTRGSHNLPKLWGDDTVRPQERITGVKSGVKAVGKQFGLGWYDGVTGLVMQPIKGAQTEGAAGFAKGVGKGLAGFVAKPLAGSLGIMSYPMKGVHKEVQKRIGNNTQSYIDASRQAQGYEEWSQSTDAGRADVITSWKLIQKYLKGKKHDAHAVMRDVLETKRVDSMGGTEASRSVEHMDATISRPSSMRTSIHEDRSSLHTLDGSQSFLGSAPGSSYEEGRTPTSPHNDVSERPHVQRGPLTNGSQSRASVAQYSPADVTPIASERQTSAPRIARKPIQREQQPAQAQERSAEEQRPEPSDHARVPHPRYSDTEQRHIANEGPSTHNGQPLSADAPPSYDRGTTRGEPRAPQQEKTAQEKTEEDIVLEYIKKQSLLEAHHRNHASDQGNDQGHSSPGEDWDEAELQRALDLSRRSHQHV